MTGGDICVTGGARCVTASDRCDRQTTKATSYISPATINVVDLFQPGFFQVF